MKKTTIVITTYNSEKYIHRLLNSIKEQTTTGIYLVFADDGSDDKTVGILNNFAKDFGNTTVLALPHKERGFARAQAISFAKRLNNEYLMILDADMSLEKNLVKECRDILSKTNIGALVIKEKPVSDFTNYVTKVKLFERTVLNNSSKKLDFNSIEAARFWKLKEYIKSGGINPDQIAFEETQPTIRYIEYGGLIEKHLGSMLLHDEKKVTFGNLFSKKKYHFKMMNKTFETEENGLLKALKRWYFFRPVMYKPVNLKLYLRHPLLTIGMIGMYFGLTFVGCREILRNKLSI